MILCKNCGFLPSIHLKNKVPVIKLKTRTTHLMDEQSIQRSNQSEDFGKDVMKEFGRKGGEFSI
jgi:hypothetical protein